VIPGERADEAACELTTEDGFQTVASPRWSLGEAGDTGTVVEEAADGPAVGGRRSVHGPLVIG
jgi:hypothetical protein